MSDGDRRSYALAFVHACRDKKLHAVAITDHHDMAFIRYVRAAATEEVSLDGTPMPVEDQLIVFPGMELTLGVPCQALLIFDAEFPEDLFALACTALAILPAPDSEPRTAETARLTHITSLATVHEKLDEHAYLRGRYVVFPNVSETGASTLLRSGFPAHYQEMPCVGGYLDGDVGQLGTGNCRILDGLDPNYGSKPLGLFQTSDNRRLDFGDLGNSSTWVKWAEPTAEGLRQACLARQSRLSQTEPLIPSTAITALNVSNSAFLGPVYLEFNPQYNAFIGGRGTGKSTLLEYVRWALCDERGSADRDDELKEDSARRRDLIAQTLAPLNAIVDVHFIVHGVAHVVRRQSATGAVSLRVGAGPFEACQASDVRLLLPIQAYSQKQLSSVGVRLEELRRFVNAPVRKQLDEIRTAIEATGGEIRRSYALVRSKRLKQRDIENDERELRSLTEQMDAVRAKLAGLSPADREVLNAHGFHEREAEIVGGWGAQLTELQVALGGALTTVGSLPPAVEGQDLGSLPNEAILAVMKAALLSKVRDVEATLKAVVDAVSTLRAAGEYAVAEAQWEGNEAAFKVAYSEAKSRSSSHQARLTELEQLENRARQIRTRLTKARSELASLGEPDQDLGAAREEWCRIHEQRSELLDSQSNRLTELSGGQIRATLKRGGVMAHVADRLRSLLSGTGLRSAKVDDLCQRIGAAASPVREAQQTMDELELLTRLEASGLTEAQLPATPRLSSAGLSAKDLLKVTAKISPDSWLDVCTTQIEDQPLFEYRLREGDYIPFADASAGQQATSLLWALLNQDGPPLVIDQPEDDLDNQVLLKVVEQMWQAKHRRQLVFASHNANMVVNGDADLVVCCDYRVMGEQSGGTIKAEGAIDVLNVRDEIAVVMEGGKAAFRLRKDKYGF